MKQLPRSSRVRALDRAAFPLARWIVLLLFGCVAPGALQAASDRVVISAAAGFSIDWDGNNGGFNNPAEGAGPSNNVALASNGVTAIGSSEFDGGGVHLIANVNDGLYGNSHSWISDFTAPDPDPWVGLSFPDVVDVSAIAWGRDNGNTVSDACGGTCMDRYVGVYTLQYTLVPNPDAATPDTDDPFTGWASLGSVEYLPGAEGPEFTGYLRHRFDVAEAGAPIAASGLRIKVSDPGTAIDEIEVNPIPDPIPPIDLVFAVDAEPGFEIAWDGNEGNFNDPSDPAVVPANIGQSGTAFGSSEFGGGGAHLIANVNDGLYGNSRSWISDFTVPDPDPFIGINLGEVVSLTSIAWGRDNGNTVSDACGGTCTDRTLGIYTLQITTRTDADAATPETGDAATGWQTVGTIHYKGNDPSLFNSHLRHRYDLSAGGNPIQAAAIRLKVPDPGIAIDEIEINPNQVIEQMLLATEAAPGFSINWDGNEGQFFSPAAIAPAPDNRALVSEGTVPFTSSDLGPVLGIGFHVAANLNDGLYGNANSWISANGVGGTDDPDPFAGLNFGGLVGITNIAWGRDNGNTATDACGGTCGDRTMGPYTLQYTLVPDPDAATLQTDDPFTGWATFATVTIGAALPPDFLPYLRHRFDVSEFGAPIEASGIRIKVPDGSIAIDEIEINAPVVEVPPDLPLEIVAAPGFEIEWDGNDGNFNDPSDPAVVPSNLGQSGTAFGSSEFGGGGAHLIANINDGLYGNSRSWIADFTVPDPDPFIGINLGEVTPITSIAWSRDNGNTVSDACGGTCTDRALGVYTLQITTRTDADATTPETGDAATGWQTVGTINYKFDDPPIFTSYLRHRFDVSASGAPVQAAAIRLKVPDAGIAVDEIEINPNQVIEQMLLATEAAPGFVISWDGNEGQFFSPAAMAPAPDNRALASQGTVPFTSSDLGPVLGIPFHVAANLNDGLYGNGNSWISANGVGGTDDPDPFAGLNFGGVVAVTGIAWGRDNGNNETEGEFTDRTQGAYLLQYTLVPEPDASTPDTGDAFTGWADLGTVTYGATTPPIFLGHLRHRYDVGVDGGGPVEASGIRIKVPNGSIAIDEIEVNTSSSNQPPTCEDILASTDEDQSVTITLSAVDPEGDPITFTIVEGPAQGTATLAGDSVLYTPAPNYCGPDSFTFQAADADGAMSDVCTVSITVSAVNDPPVGVVEIDPASDLGESVGGHIVISPDNTAVCVVLDASASIDLDADSGCGATGAIEYLWMAADGTLLGVGPVLESCLPVGRHEITLLLDDGETAGGTLVSLEILTGCEAVEQLILQVEESVVDRATKRPFLATLKTACAAFDRGSVNSALNRLDKAFQNKVRAQIGKNHPDVAEEWIRIAQEIIEAYTAEPACSACE